METVYKNNKTKLRSIMKYGYYGSLSKNTGYIAGTITLKKIDDEIENKRKLRHEILKRFYDDITNKLLFKKITCFKMIVDSRRIWNNDFLNFKIEKNDFIAYPKVSIAGIEKSYNDDINECLEIIFPFIKGMCQIHKEIDLLENNFYDSILVKLMGSLKPIFSISGDGISIVHDDELKQSQYEDLVRFLETYKYEILNNVSIFDNESLNPYRTDLTKRKALSIYKRGMK